MTVSIHPHAIVDPAARIGASVTIGPFCVVGPDVVLEDGVRLHSHVVVEGRTRIGPGTQIFPFASIGHAPQDLKYHGEPSELIIGANNRIREHVTMNPGTEGGGMVTKVGDNCLFMMASHVAHDCIVGNNVILANNATLGGHVTVGDHAILGGLSAVHQFVRIGAHAMIGGMSGRRAGCHSVRPRDGRARPSQRLEPCRPSAPRVRQGCHPHPPGRLQGRCSRRKRRWPSGSIRSARSSAGSPSSVTSCPSSARKRRVRSANPAWRMLPKLGIIAGGGDLPVRLLDACRSIGREAFVLGLEGHAEPDGIGRHVDLWVRLGAAGTMLDALRAAGARDIVLAGRVRRPSLAELKPDWRGAKFFARIGARALGDDGLLKAVTAELEGEGFHVVAAQDVFRDLLTPPGLAGRPQARRTG